jgi:hypothetical protein
MAIFLPESKPFYIAAGDLRPVYEAILRNADGTLIPNLDQAESIEFRMSHENDIKRITGDAEIVNATESHVKYEWTLGDTDTPGQYFVAFRVIWPTAMPQTIPSEAYKKVVIKELIGDDA